MWKHSALAFSLLLNVLLCACLLYIGKDRVVNYPIAARRKLLQPQSSALVVATAPITADTNQPYQVYGEISKRRNNGLFRPNFLIAPRTREDLGSLLESLGNFHVGVELGVQTGAFAAHMLSTWPSCKKYYLVDLWAQQVNYHDFANVDNQQQERILNDCKSKLAPWQGKTVFVRNYTSAATAYVPDEVDFIYVDARHDYCGAKEDVELWWPKLRRGGIMAGHDYLHAEEVKPGQDWSKCLDGTVNQGAVMGAVNEFAMKHSLTVSVTWGEPHPWRTWVIRKTHKFVSGK